MRISIFLAILALLCYSALGRGHEENEATQVKKNVEYFDKTLKAALNAGRLDAVHFLVSLANLILRGAASEEVGHLAKRLTKEPATFEDFIHLVERAPFDGQNLLIREVFMHLTQRPASDVLPQLIQLKRHFPLVTSRLFDNWLAGIDRETGLTLDDFERMLKDDVILQKAHLGTDSVRTLLTMIHRGHSEDVRELLVKGHWRTGIASFLALDPTGEQVQELLAGILDYPLAFTQLFILAAERFALVNVAPARTSLGVQLQLILSRILSLKQPQAICQRLDGKTIVLKGSLFPPGLTQLDERTKREMIYGIISWITFVSYDCLPNMRHNERDSPATIFNAAIERYCSGYSDLYPGVYMEEGEEEGKH